MTNEKAIKLLSDMYKVSRGSIYGDAIKSGLAALEKQIPKKPNELDIDNSGICDWTCGTCGRFHRNDFVLNFCSECGQAIEWSDEDDV